MNVKLGEKVRRKVWALDREMTGVVRWIHPKGRYFLVYYTLPGGVLRECYKA